MKIVAEMSCNHLGSMERALDLVRAAKAGGADAVKIQTWEPGTMVLDPTIVLRTGPWAGTNLHELYERAHTPWEWLPYIFRTAKEVGIECFASAFDAPSVDFLEVMACPRYKVASFEIVDIPLIRKIAKTRKPMIMSTGMAGAEEIALAVEAARDAGAVDITLLKCTSAYPADGSAMNLATMRTMARRWNVDVGLSDHTPGIGVSIAAVAMGASMIERHLTMDRALGGPDAAFSLEPRELLQLCTEARGVLKAWGSDAHYGATEHEQPQLELRRSLYFAADLPAGTYLGEDHVRSARPAKGLPPRLLHRVLGGKLIVGVRRGQPVTWDVVERPAAFN